MKRLDIYFYSSILGTKTSAEHYTAINDIRQITAFTIKSEL